MKIDQKQKTEIEVQLVTAIIDGHHKHNFSYVQMKKSARYILKHLDKISTHEELVHFLHNLSSHWMIFTSIFQREQKMHAT
jgi:hypothetical protein